MMRVALVFAAVLLACVADADAGIIDTVAKKGPMPYDMHENYEADWAFEGSEQDLKLKRAAARKQRAEAKALKTEDLARSQINIAGDAPASAPGPAPGPSPGPSPGPAPVPYRLPGMKKLGDTEDFGVHWESLDYNEQMVKTKEDMTTRLGGNSFDADYVLNRPNEVKAGDGEAHPVRSYQDIFPYEVGAPSPGPAAPGQAPSPGPMGFIPFLESSLPDMVNHKNEDTMTEDWRSEYGPSGPQRQADVIKGPHIKKSFKGWSENPTAPPKKESWWTEFMYPNGKF